jgi:hypothetical protein
MRLDNSEPFSPGVTVSLAATAATGNVALTNATGKVKQQLRIYNAGAEAVFIKLGGSTVTAAVTDMPVPAGLVEVISIPVTGAAVYVAGITASGNCTVYATVGEGV